MLLLSLDNTIAINQVKARIVCKNIKSYFLKCRCFTCDYAISAKYWMLLLSRSTICEPTVLRLVPFGIEAPLIVTPKKLLLNWIVSAEPGVTTVSGLSCHPIKVFPEIFVLATRRFLILLLTAPILFGMAAVAVLLVPMNELVMVTELIGAVDVIPSCRPILLLKLISDLP